MLLPRLQQLQHERGISDEVHLRTHTHAHPRIRAQVQAGVLAAHGLDVGKAVQEGGSLVELCDTEVGIGSSRHTEAYKVGDGHG